MKKGPSNNKEDRLQKILMIVSSRICQGGHHDNLGKQLSTLTQIEGKHTIGLGWKSVTEIV